MKYLHVNTKVLTFFLFFLLLLPSCNNEEIFVIEESAIIAEETEPTEEETPNTEDEVIPIDIVDDAVITSQDMPVDIEAYLNDINLPENITISNTNPSDGVLSINTNETPDNLLDDTIIYTPNGGFFGIDSFDYTVCDALNSENCDTATVTITVEPLEGDTNAELLAFPTAYGAGAYSTGGRGGIVVHVTNLNASGTGSLLWALTDAAHISKKKTIVFDVSGVITLNGNITVASPRQYSNFAHGLTIAGQTAPEGGITITGGKIRMFGVDDVIVRYMKFRETRGTDGCFSNLDGNNIIFDHLSASHTPDICFSLTSSVEFSDNKTLQHCLLSNSKNGFITGDTTPQNSSTYYERVSILRNAAYKVGWRFPLKGGGRVRVDAINNIMHNWDARTLRMDGHPYELNHIGNYYQGGGSEQKHTSYLSKNGDPKIYNLDNYLDPAETFPSYETDESVAWNQFQAKDGNGKKIYDVRLPSSYFTNTPNPIRGRAIPILSSSQVLAEVVPEVGAFRYIKDDGTVGIYRDTYDTEAVNGIIANDSGGRNTSLSNITSLSNTRPDNFYNPNKSLDIPEVWYDAHGLTTQLSTDLAPSGYTWMEEYLNEVDK